MSLWTKFIARKTDSDVEAAWNRDEADTLPDVRLVICSEHQLPGERKPATFNPNLNILTCPSGHAMGVECPRCRLGVMRYSELETTSGAACNRCGHRENGIPRT